MPLFDADDTGDDAVLGPSAIGLVTGVPRTAVVAFLPDAVNRLAAREGWRSVGVLNTYMAHRDVWVCSRPSAPDVGVMHVSLGAPWAAMQLEQLIASGVERVIAVGTCGVLVPDVVMGHPVVVTGALADEGTSAHYAYATPEFVADPVAAQALREALTAAGVEFAEGKTWSTDGIFRETRARVQRRVDAGCMTVDMECSALMAVAAYRGVTFGQLLFSGDSLAGDAWDHRDFLSGTDAHDGIVSLALDAAARLDGMSLDRM